MNDIDVLEQKFREQLGTRETGENNVIYNTHYYGGPVQGGQYPWCCAFIWDVFRMAGRPALFCGGEKTAWCPYVVTWAKAHGQWVTKDYCRGDLLLFDWDGDGQADHIGFCTRWSGDAGKTIEGNHNNGVYEVSRTSAQVLGAFRPAYKTDELAPETPQVPEAPAVIPAESAYTVKQGDSLWSIAERMLGNGFRFEELRRMNGLKGYTIYPGQTLLLPGSDETVTITILKRVWEALQERAKMAGKTVEEYLEDLPL